MEDLTRGTKKDPEKYLAILAGRGEKPEERGKN
jgi:hypothetical protein